MPTQKDTQSQIARKVNFAIQLLRPGESESGMNGHIIE